MVPEFSKTKIEHGQSLVELAISFTFLIFLVCGVLDLGMMYYTYLSLRDTAQEGAIFASYNPIPDYQSANHPTSTDNIYLRIKDSSGYPINSSSIVPGNITITCSNGACDPNFTTSCQGQKITVGVNYDYHFLTPVISWIAGSTYTLNATVTETILESDLTIATLNTKSPPGSCN